MINDKTAAIDIQITLLTDKDFFFPVELDSADADGPSVCVLGLLWEDGVCAEVGDPEMGGAVDDVGGVEGAILLLKRFPSFLHEKQKQATIIDHNRQGMFQMVTEWSNNWYIDLCIYLIYLPTCTT